MGVKEELLREVQTIDLGDLALFSVGTGVAHAIAGVPAGPVGVAAGFAAGALRGALTYIASYGVGLATYGVTGDPKLALSSRRLSEVVLSAGNIWKSFRISKPPKKVDSAPQSPRSPRFRVPQELKVGFNALSLGLTAGWVLEPYLVDDGEAMSIKPMGISALAASAYLVSRPLAPLGLWGYYSARQVVSMLSEGRKAGGVLVLEPMKWTGRFQLPKLKIGDEGLEVLAVDPMKEGLWHANMQVAELRWKLDRIATVLHKYGIRVGTPLSRRLAVELFDPLEEVTLAQRLRRTLKEEGFTDQAIAELSSAIEEWQKVSLSIADKLVELGGASPYYLASLGGSKRFFQHVFRKPKDRVDFIEAVAERVLEKGARSPLPTIATAKRRGISINPKSERGLKITKAFERKFGRKPEIGEYFEFQGVRFLYTPLKEGKKPVWWAETVKPESEDVILDLSASLYVQLSQDLRLLKEFHFLKYLDELGRLTGKVISDPARGKALGYVKLGDRVQSSPVLKKWGPLTGKWVSPDLRRVIEAYMAMDRYLPPKFPVIGRGLAWLNRGWKNLRLGLALKSWENAFFGNLLISFAQGKNPLDVLSHAVVGLVAKDKASKAFRLEAQKFGLLKTGIAYETLDEEMLELRKILSSDVGKLEAMGWKVYAFTQSVIQRGIKGFSFGNIDALFKFGFYRMLRLEGVSAEEAAKKAAFAFGYYGDMPVIARSLRDTVMPFISFQMRVIPQVFSALYRNPVRLATVALMFEGIQRTAFRELYGEKWKEGMELESMDLVKYAFMDFRPGAFISDFIRTPTLVFQLENQEVEIPGGYMYAGWIPWNIPLSIPHVSPVPGKDPATVWLATSVIQNPILRFATGLLTHVDPAVGRKIGGYERLKPPSVLDLAIRTLSPVGSAWSSFLQLNAKEGWFDPIIGWSNYFGTYPNGEPVGRAHMIWNALAPTVMKFDPQWNTEFALRRLEALERGWLRDYRRAMKRASSGVVLEENWHALEEKVEELYKLKADLVERYLSTQ